MECLRCRFDNPARMKFCVECGARLALSCPRCGAEMLGAYKFCGECGAPLRTESAPGVDPAPVPEPAPPGATPSPRSPDEGERKQASVLFSDLVTSAATPIGPDVLHGWLNRFFKLAQAEIERYGGTINRFLGQGCMALFGAPVAFEDHPRRAVLAALGLEKRLAEHALEDGVRWQARTGIDTGTVVVGGIGDTAVGEATAVAGRLQQLAPPGAVLVSGRTAKLVRPHVDLEPRQSVASGDGRGEDLEVWRVVDTASGLGVARSLHAESSGPFVGRDHELSVLEQLREQAASGRGQVVGLAGEAGSGKSRLLYEFFRRTFTGRQVSYLRGQCLSYGSGVPYLPLVDMIRGASRITESEEASGAVAKMRASLELVGVDDTESLPYFMRLLGFEEGSEALDELNPQAVQARTFATMRHMLLTASRRTLVVMELEDLHWIDDTSAEFLDSLVEVMSPTRLLLLVSYRSGYQPRWLEKSYATQLTMRRLSKKDSRKLVGAILERSELPEDLTRDINDKAEGNPFFLEELARSWMEHGGASAGEIPDTVQGILMARIDRLPREHKQLLRIASVLGREISQELLEVLWEHGEQLESLLEDLRRWELLYKAPSEDETVHFFKHALTREAAYQSLLTPRRQELHARVAETLEELYAEHLEDAYNRLIYHYPRAGRPAKTVHYLTLFAARAARSYAHAEAAKALRQALTQVEELPAEVRDRRLIEVLLQLAESLLPLAGFPETLELFERYQDRLEKLEEPSLEAQYHFWLAHTHTYLGNQEETRAAARRAITAARECGDEATEGKACYVLGRDGFWSGQFSEGIRYSLRAVVLLERSGEPWWQGQAYWVAGFNHYVLGQFEDAVEVLVRANTIGEALDDYRLDTSWSLGYFYASLGEAQLGIEQCQRGLERSQDPLNTTVAMGFLGYALLHKGDLESAVETLRNAVERLRQTGMQQLLGWFSVFLAEALLAADQLDGARGAVEQGLEITHEAKFQYGTGLAQRTWGRIALAGGDLEEARQRLGEAFETFTSLQVPLEIGRTRLELARLARAEGDSTTASGELGEALDSFTELQVRSYVEHTEELAEELGIRPADHG